MPCSSLGHGGSLGNGGSLGDVVAEAGDPADEALTLQQAQGFARGLAGQLMLLTQCPDRRYSGVSRVSPIGDLGAEDRG